MSLADLSLSSFDTPFDDIIRNSPRNIDWLVLLLISSYNIIKFALETYGVELTEVTFVPQPCGRGIAKHPCIQYLEEEDQEDAGMLIGDQSGPLLIKDHLNNIEKLLIDFILDRNYDFCAQCQEIFYFVIPAS